MQRKHWILFGIVLATLTLRLLLAYSISDFSPDSYFHLRQVESILENGLPSYQDDLSYGGREYIFLPLYHYVTAAFALIFPLEFIAKFLNNFVFVLLIPVIFMISEKISKRENSALFSAIVAALLPINFMTNSFTPLAFSLLFLFLSINYFLECQKSGKEKTYYFIGSLLILFLSSSLASILIFSFLVYLLLSYVEETRVYKSESELIIFSTFLFLWIQLIFFKDIFLAEGFSFIWKNIPPQIINDFFPKVSITKTILFIGVIPLLGGLFFIYGSLFEKKNKNLFLLVSFAISSIVLAWFKLIPFRTALAFLGLLLAIIFTSFYEQLINYYQKTRLSIIDKKISEKINKVQKVKQFANITSVIILIILIPSMLIPAISFSLNQNVIDSDIVHVFTELKDKTKEGSVILTDLEEGHALSFFSGRKNFMDTHFNLIDDVEDRFEAFRVLYTGLFETEALKLLDKYNIKYIVMSKSVKQRFGVEDSKDPVKELLDFIKDMDRDQGKKFINEIHDIIDKMQ